MMVILILLGAIVGVGALLYLEHRRYLAKEARKPARSDSSDPTAASECCGMHITCEKDSLLASVSPGIEYFDDEELDRFAGRAAASYTPEEADEFRDVLLTTRPDEIAAWARSLQLRGIALPSDVRDELIMIVAEARQNRTADVAVS